MTLSIEKLPSSAMRSLLDAVHLFKNNHHFLCISSAVAVVLERQAWMKDRGANAKEHRKRPVTSYTDNGRVENSTVLSAVVFGKGSLHHHHLLFFLLISSLLLGKAVS